MRGHGGTQPLSRPGPRELLDSNLAVSSVLAQGLAADECLPLVLAALQPLGWTFGAIWQPTAGGGALR
ncbi:MAG: hypothetical protein QOK40_3772 [Miltoncostaeaceae bacterium]|nr:hypothetical protein [Miltoncostaeaceae bacterium]